MIDLWCRERRHENEIRRAKRFARPVVIRAGGSYRTVVDVSAAAKILLKEYPRETAKRKQATIACLGSHPRQRPFDFRKAGSCSCRARGRDFGWRLKTLLQVLRRGSTSGRLQITTRGLS